MKKFVSVLLAATVAVSSAVMLAGCGEEEYPVEIANYTIEKEPENVVVLDPVSADIMAYMSLDRKLAGRSEEVTQPSLEAAPVVGSEQAPDVKKIAELHADLVICSEDTGEDTIKKLEQEHIQVMKLQKPNTTAEVKTNYETIGKALGGKIQGAASGKESYSKLVQELEKQKRDVEGLSGTGALNTICYLYAENKKLSKLASGSYGNILMGYTNCVNIFSVGSADATLSPSEDTAKVVVSANPDFIFCDSEETVKAIKGTKGFAELNAVKNNKMKVIPLQNMSLCGITAGTTVQTMIDFIYAGKLATPDEAAKTTTAPANKAASKTESTSATKAAETTAPATTAPATTAPAESSAASGEVKDVSADYGVKLDGLNLAKTNENDDVKAMQQRLFDLGYITKNGDDTNITGYYGDITEAAVKEFQKQNGIKETGEADNATLKAMFSSDAKKAS